MKGSHRVRVLDRLLTMVLVICAVATTAALVRQQFFPSAVRNAGPRPDLTPREISGWDALRSTGRLREGRAEASVTLVEFSDFQCPFCAQFRLTLNKVVAKYSDRVTLVYRHFPLDEIHPYARTAALAAECAADQRRFAEFRDLLFKEQTLIGSIWT